MRNFLFICLLSSLFPLVLKGQQDSSSIVLEKVRVQGYLIIEGHHETIRKGSDIPRKFIFIPLKKFENQSFLSVYEKECQPEHKDLFIPTSFMEKIKLVELNTFLRRTLNSSLKLKWEYSVNDSFEDYLKTESVFFKVKDSNKELNVTFLDGIWGKVIVPYKYSGSTNIEGYNMTRLKKLENGSEFYEYFYLLATESFSPVIFINDESLVRVN